MASDPPDDTFTLPSAPKAPAENPAEPSLIGGRFTIEFQAGRGGMGAIYRAIDSRTGQRVALKLLHGLSSPEVAYRFKREAVLLDELRHPAIVTYVDHGTTQTGQPYLAMEWLEGEDLAHRLARAPLELSESLSLLRRVTEALVTAHQQGIVHRDIKPSNLFLRAGRPEDVVVLDFGLARQVVSTLVGVTGSNMVVGTPGYMAPEQASSQHEITSSADIFSLGCVLYECLTGKPPFAAPHFAAVLAKILYADPVPLHTLRPNLPPGLQVLVDRMLVKDPRRRLPDAASLLQSLSALESVPGLLPPRSAEQVRPQGLAGAERQLFSVLLISFRAGATGEQGAETARGLPLRDALRTALAPYGAQVELLADGSLVVTLLPERGTATDQAVLAARCGLTLKERWPEAAVVLVTGLGVLSERLPVGEAMDKAGRLLRQLEQAPGSASFVMMDEVTAGLLGPGFQLSRFDSGTCVLRGEQLSADASRPLLGRPTPCVGREQELALLEFTFASCIEESAARALLVSAPAGVGKSRLRHEFLRRIERKEQPVLMLLGRGDSMSAGAAYGLLGQALRRLCGIAEGQNLEARRSRLYQRVALRLPGEGAQDVAEFLGELCAVSFPEEGNARLRAARDDPRLMSAQVSRALATFLQAECSHQPVLLVLEDLHWSDALTVKLVDELLRELAEQPFMVLALARPEVKELFPNLWSRRPQELSLQGLSRKAGTKLVREVLGPQVSDAVIQRAVEQSDGNALFLEELIRMAAEGRGESAPETVLAVLQARLGRMELGARQVLLAASIFGRTFRAAGVKALWTQQGDDALERHLQQLVAQELVEPLPDSPLSSGGEFRFRHALMREAAYGLVPEPHRATAHQLAGAWLEQQGEPDVLMLATHYQLGQQLERAVSCYTRAAEQHFERHDLQGTMRCVEGALACGVKGEARSRLRALQAVVLFWMDQMPRAVEIGGSVLNALKAGSPLWCRLMGGLVTGYLFGGQQEQAARASELLLRTSPAPEALAAYAEALTVLGSAAVLTGSRQQAESALGRIVEVGAEVIEHDVLVRGWMRLLKEELLCFFDVRPWQVYMLAEQGSRDFSAVGLARVANIMQSRAGFALAALGEVPSAVELLRKALAEARRTEEQIGISHARQCMCQVLLNSSEPAHQQEGYDLALEWLACDEPDAFRRSTVRALLAKAMVGRGAPREAETHAREACALLMPLLVPSRVYARTVLSTVLLAQGRGAEARQVAELGVRDLEQMNCQGVFAVGMHLTLAEACFADGDVPEGEAALRNALRCVRACADDIPDPAAQARFLSQVPENARTLALARQRWGESAT